MIEYYKPGELLVNRFRVGFSVLSVNSGLILPFVTNYNGAGFNVLPVYFCGFNNYGAVFNNFNFRTPAGDLNNAVTWSDQNTLIMYFIDFNTFAFTQLNSQLNQGIEMSWNVPVAGNVNGFIDCTIAYLITPTV